MSRLQAPGGSSGLKKPSGMVKPGSSSALTVKNLQRASQVISDQQTQHHRSLSNSSNSSLGSSISNKSASHLPAKTGMPMKRLQLMQPSKIQKNSLALNRSKLSETSTKKSCGPMKAVAPSSTPHESIGRLRIWNSIQCDFIIYVKQLWVMIYHFIKVFKQQNVGYYPSWNFWHYVLYSLVLSHGL